MTDNHHDVPEVGDPIPPKRLDVVALESAVRDLLVALGQDGKSEVMANTPYRVAQMWAEVMNPANIDIEIPWKCFPNPGYDDQIMVLDTHYVSYCEHHLAPAFGVAHFAYAPDKLITGYSKIKKGLNYLARQPTLNERLLVDTLDVVEQVLQPLGCALVLQSVHTCLACKANAPSQESVVVQGFRGVYRDRDQPWYRREFMDRVAAARPSYIGA